MIIGHVSDTHISSKRLDEKIRCADQIAEHFEHIRPDVIVHSGDFFDSSIRMEDPAAIAGMQWMRDLASIAPVIMVRGNYAHDRNSVEMLRFLRGPRRISVAMEPCIWLKNKLDDHVDQIALDTPFNHESPLLQAVFVGLPYPSAGYLAKSATLSPEAMRKAVSDSIADVIRGFAAIQVPPNVPKILIAHGTIVGCMYSEDQREMGVDIDISPSDIAGAGFDLSCLGHIHCRQEIDPHIFYPGGMAITHFNDNLEKGCWIHEFDDNKKLTSRHFDVHSVPMRSFNIDFSDPFFDPPEWANETMELELRIQLAEADRERLAAFDWKAIFPNATITTKVTVEQVASVRCEDVQKAKSLPDKVTAWAKNKEVALPQGLLAKAQMLETMSEAELIANLQEA